MSMPNVRQGGENKNGALKEEDMGNYRENGEKNTIFVLRSTKSYKISWNAASKR